MQNTDYITDIEQAEFLLTRAAAQAKALAADKTPMPDRVGTVQSRYNAAVARFEMNWLQLLAASNLQPPEMAGHQPPPRLPTIYTPLAPIAPLAVNIVPPPLNPAALRPYPDPTPFHHKQTAGLMTK